MKDTKIYFDPRGIEQMFRNDSIIGIISSVHMPWVTGMGTDDYGRIKYGQVWNPYDRRWHNYRCHRSIPVQYFIMKDGSFMSAEDMRDLMMKVNTMAVWADNYVGTHEW